MASKKTRWSEPRERRRRRVATIRRKAPVATARITLFTVVPIASMIAAQRIWLPEVEIDWVGLVVIVLLIAAGTGILFCAMFLLRERFTLTDETIGSDNHSSPRRLTAENPCVIASWDGLDYLLIPHCSNAKDLWRRAIQGATNRTISACPLPEEAEVREKVLSAVGDRLTDALPPEFASLVQGFRAHGTPVSREGTGRQVAEDRAPNTVEWAFTFAYAVVLGYITCILSESLPGFFADLRFSCVASMFVAVFAGPGTILEVWRNGSTRMKSLSESQRRASLNLGGAILAMHFVVAWAVVRLLNSI